MFFLAKRMAQQFFLVVKVHDVSSLFDCASSLVWLYWLKICIGCGNSVIEVYLTSSLAVMIQYSFLSIEIRISDQSDICFFGWGGLVA